MTSEGRGISFFADFRPLWAAQALLIAVLYFVAARACFLLAISLAIVRPSFSPRAWRWFVYTCLAVGHCWAS